MIIFAHSTQRTSTIRGDWNSLISLVDATSDKSIIFCLFCAYLGAVGYCFFVICSSWFLFESNRVSVKKVIRLWADVFIISVANTVIMKCIYPEIGLGLLIKQFFPFTFRQIEDC